MAWEAGTFSRWEEWGGGLQGRQTVTLGEGAQGPASQGQAPYPDVSQLTKLAEEKRFS